MPPPGTSGIERLGFRAQLNNCPAGTAYRKNTGAGAPKAPSDEVREAMPYAELSP